MFIFILILVVIILLFKPKNYYNYRRMCLEHEELFKQFFKDNVSEYSDYTIQDIMLFSLNTLAEHEDDESKLYLCYFALLKSSQNVPIFIPIKKEQIKEICKDKNVNYLNLFFKKMKDSYNIKQKIKNRKNRKKEK